jgi:hypothetical protein
MSEEIKPVAWMRSEIEKADCQFGYYGPVECYPDDVPLYAIPATHRIVSVELLERAELSLCREAQGHVHKDWDGPLNFAEQLRAIIDKEPT